MTLRETIAVAAAFAAFATTSAETQAPAALATLPAGSAEAPVIQAAEPAVSEKPVIQAAKPDEPEKAAVESANPEEGAPAKKKKPKPKKELTGRDAKITSATMSYDRKEGILFFDRNVFVDDEQYQMHADRVYVFLNGTNDVKRLVALGNVALTNEFRSATCDKAVYMKAASKVILYAPEGGVATLKDESQKGGTISGSRITFWLDSEQVEVQNSDITVPGGAFKANDAKKLLGK